MNSVEKKYGKYNIKKGRSSSSIVSINEDELVSGQLMFPEKSCAYLFNSNHKNLKLDVWSQSNQGLISSKLLEHGAVVFRGFKMSSDELFLEYIDSSPYEPLNYLERSSPRKNIGSKVYTSTIYPSDEIIPLHNENTASISFAMKVWFFCLQPAAVGGETPIANSRKILADIDPEVLDKFRKLGWVLVRNYGNHLGYNWKDAFDGKTKEQVDAYCLENYIEVKWNGTDHLWTKQHRSATVIHPHTGEESWFNHIAFWHPANLNPSVLEFMLSEVGIEGLPYNTFYGDGSVIPDEVALHLRDAYKKNKMKFAWQQGDVMMIDNILSSHGREAFEGDRKIRVSLADKYTRPLFEI